MKAVVALIAVGLAGLASPASLPSNSLPPYVKTCNRHRSDFDNCVLSSLQKLHPYLVKGIPELDLPPFDPYKEDERTAEYENGLVQMKVTAKDSVSYGITGMVFLDVRTNFADEKDMVIQVDVYIPKMKHEGKYKIQGKLIGSEMATRGSFELTMLNLTATWDLHGSLETINGDQYLKIKEFNMSPTIGDLRFYASDLFNGNEALTKMALNYFNENWRQIMAEILPHVRGKWSEIMTEFANRVFLKVPYNQIFPDSS